METREEKLKSLNISKKQINLLSDSALVGENIIIDVLFHATELKIIPSKQSYNDLLEALMSIIYESNGTYLIGQHGDTEVPDIVINAINKATK